MSDDVVDLPFRAEYAKSGRAACKLCKEKIDKGVLRLAIMVQVRLLCTYHFLNYDTQNCSLSSDVPIYLYSFLCARLECKI